MKNSIFYFNLKMPFKLTYIKLTTFYALIIMIVSIAFSISIHRISSAEIDRGLSRQVNIFRGMPVNPSYSITFDQLEQSRLTQAEESKEVLMVKLIYYNLLILILSAIGSYFLAKWTLKPIKESMEAQNRFIFDRFYRADLSRSKEKADGYGLGLSIAKRIIEMHKASISVTSTPGQGSEFVVRF